MARRKTVQSSLSSGVHFDRWIRVNRTGESIGDVARKDKVSVDAVKRSIASVELFKGRNTVEAVNQELIDVVRKCSPAMQGAIIEALGATIEYKQGETITTEPDNSMRMLAVERLTELAKVVQPKGGGTSVNVGVGVVANANASAGPYVGMEERLSEIRKQIATAPVLEGSTVQAAALTSEYADDEEDSEEVEA